jgi:malate synthase
MPNQASSSLSLPEGVMISGALKPGYGRILTSDALEFVASLARRFEPRRRELMQARLSARNPQDPRQRLENHGHS